MIGLIIIKVKMKNNYNTSIITHIKNDLTISKDDLKQILTDGMSKYCNNINFNKFIIIPLVQDLLHFRSNRL